MYSVQNSASLYPFSDDYKWTICLFVCIQCAQLCMLNSVLGILWSKCPLSTNLPAGFDGDCCVIWILPSLISHVTVYRKLSNFSFWLDILRYRGWSFIYSKIKTILTNCFFLLLHTYFDWNEWVQHVALYIYPYFILSVVVHGKWFFLFVVVSWTWGYIHDACMSCTLNMHITYICAFYDQELISLISFSLSLLVSFKIVG